jgi:hypothetical protein
MLSTLRPSCPPPFLLRQVVHHGGCRRPFSISLPVHNATKRPDIPKLLGRFHTFPLDLFRVNASDKVILRDYDTQKKLGRTSYDFKMHKDGMIHPKTKEYFEGE